MPKSEQIAHQAALHCLQRFLSPKAGMPDALYFGKGSQFQVREGGDVVLLEGERIEGNTFFNAFFLEFWRARTAIGKIGIRCRANGAMRLRLNGHLKGGQIRLVALWDHSGEEEASLRWVWHEAGGGDIVRLSLSVEALTEVRIAEIAFVTDRTPWRPVRLAVGLVTHNREAMFETTARALVELSKAMPDLVRVYVVNHGRAFRSEALRDLANAPLFRVVEQPNLGGCGGFARAMIDAMDGNDRPTHLLLMDDDILLDPRIVARAVAFAAHAVTDVAIGGQAIELERPTRLQEAWGRLGENWLPRMEGANLDLTEPESLRFWEVCPDVHYNGWWFCMMPMRAIRTVGLPAPIFIRGDDIEYGLRLRQARIPLVPLPGLGVWHASVRYKHVGMVQYYDLRNGLINASAHPDFAPLPGALHVVGWAMHHLLVHRYRAAVASLMAVADFLAGPETALGRDGADRHRHLSAALEGLPMPVRRKGLDLSVMRHPDEFDVTRSVPITVLSVIWLVAKILLRPQKRHIDVVQMGSPDPRAIDGESYLLALDPEGKTCLEMVPRRWLFLRLVIWALVLGVRHRLTHRRAMKNWRAKLPFLRGRARWAREFARFRE